VVVSVKIVTGARLENSITRGNAMTDISMKSEAEDAEQYLREQGFEHLRARHRGKIVTIESGPEGDAVKHARFRKDTVHLWILEVADHRDRWERTGLRDTIDNLRAALVEEFPWVLEKII
jgi:hypothetical protein